MMSCQELLGIVKERGLTVVLANGQPKIKGPKEAITPILLEVLSLHRDELVAYLQPTEPTPASDGPAIATETAQQPTATPEPERPAVDPRQAREWLWRTGHTEQERPGDDTIGQVDYHRATAWWWRYMGEATWQTVPGRPIPEGVTADHPWGQR